MSQSPELLRKTEVMGWASSADFVSMFLIPITIVWWSVWYPGAEPGGGGFIVQRLLAAKNENHAEGATFFFTPALAATAEIGWSGGFGFRAESGVAFMHLGVSYVF